MWKPEKFLWKLEKFRWRNLFLQNTLGPVKLHFCSLTLIRSRPLCAVLGCSEGKCHLDVALNWHSFPKSSSRGQSPSPCSPSSPSLSHCCRDTTWITQSWICTLLFFASRKSSIRRQDLTSCGFWAPFRDFPQSGVGSLIQLTLPEVPTDVVRLLLRGDLLTH